VNAPRQVVLSGYYGYGNVGDDALCEALTAALLAAGVDHIHIPCGNPALLPRDDRIVPLGRYDLGAVRRVLRGGGVLFSGGGGLLQNTTSSRSLAYYLGLLQIARWQRRPYVLGFQSIGPLHGRCWSRQVRRLALGAHAISVRDHGSAQALVALGVPAEQVHIAADAAFLLAAPASEPPASSPDPPRLALCLRATRHTERVLDAVRGWWRAGGWPGSLLLLACCADDHELGQRLSADLGERVLAVPPLGPSGLMQALGSCDLVISERLHPLVFATLLGLPCAAIDYDPKVRGLAVDLDLPIAGTDSALADADLAGVLAELTRRGEGERSRLLDRAQTARALAEGEVHRLLAALAD